MASRDSRSEYERRMHRVVEHIDRHLAEPLELARLAEVAHFSPFHFHRLFRAWMGETLADYVRRRRVELAAQRLATQPRVTVLEAALAFGFGSGEAFARAFRQRFGASPTAWRTQMRKRGQAERKIGQAHEASVAKHGGSLQPLVEPEPMTDTLTEVRLVDRPATRVAFLRHTGPYGEPVLRFYAEQVLPWMQRHRLMNRERYGIAHDDPYVTAPAQCRYDACVELADDEPVPPSLMTTTLPAGRHAVLAYRGTAADIDGAWKRLLHGWLPDSGLQLGGGPCFEHYPQGAGFDAATGTFACDICIPVVPL